MKVKVATVQMETSLDRNKNVEKVLSFIDQAGGMGVRLVCFHEYLVTECPESQENKKEILEKAEPIPGPFTQAVGERAKKNDLYVVPGSLFEVDQEKLYNTSPLIGPDGLVLGRFRKMHPENASAKYEIGCGITPGDGYPLFETEIGKIAIMIDMDGTVPAVSEIYGLENAEILCWPVNWSARWYRTVRILSQAHGITSKCHILCANRVGLRKKPGGDLVYSGGTQITDPEGNVLAAVSDFHEGIGVTEIDTEFTRNWRKEVIPRDYPVRRRPETYGRIAER